MGKHAKKNTNNMQYSAGNQPAGFGQVNPSTAQYYGGQYPNAFQQGNASAYDASNYSAPKKKRNGGKIFAIVLLVLLLLLAGAYAGVAIYFSSHFMPDANIGEVDVSLKSTDEAAKAIENHISEYSLEISNDRGFAMTVSADVAGVSVDGKKVAENALAEVNPWEWPLEIPKEHDLSTAVSATFNEGGMEAAITEAVKEFNKSAEEPTNATVKFDKKQNQYVVVPEEYGTALDASKVVDAAGAAVLDLAPTLELNDSVLKLPKRLSDDERLIEIAEQANTMIAANFDIILDGNTVASVDGSLISDWITLSYKKGVKLDTEAMGEWAQSVASDCNTVGTTRVYERPDGKKLEVSGGDYGWSIDDELLVENVLSAIESGSTENVEVSYSSYAKAYNGPGEKDWGNRYIDVDLNEQHAYMYNDDGKLIWESDIISGVPNEERMTPEGVYDINAMRTHELLKTYNPGEKEPTETTVEYWLPFVDNLIALHDAWWQPGFGGTMYKDGYGSHGCVNLPPEKAAEIYDIAEVGDVVVVHW